MRSPGPHREGDAGGSRSRAATEPPHFLTTEQAPQENPAASGLLFLTGYLGGFRDSWFNRSNHLIPNQVLEQLTMNSASPRAPQGQRKILGTCPAVVHRLLFTRRSRDRDG